MPEYDNKLEGVLFKNNNKTKESQPGWVGTWYDEDGNEFWLSCWINTPRGGGEKYMKLKLGDAKEPMRKSTPTSDKDDEFDDDIPF